MANIEEIWAKIGYDKLTENDYARLEPFLEPFDGIYTDKEVVILSRVGNNGIQKEFCNMFVQNPQQSSTEQKSEDEVWVLEW